MECVRGLPPSRLRQLPVLSPRQEDETGADQGPHRLGEGGGDESVADDDDPAGDERGGGVEGSAEDGRRPPEDHVSDSTATHGRDGAQQ